MRKVRSVCWFPTSHSDRLPEETSVHRVRLRYALESLPISVVQPFSRWTPGDPVSKGFGVSVEHLKQFIQRVLLRMLKTDLYLMMIKLQDAKYQNSKEC